MEAERVDTAAREAEAREEDFLCMSDASLSLLKEFKRSRCHRALLELGCDEVTALAAAAATGCDADRAVALLMDGGLAHGSRPVLVTQEAQELLAFGGSLGLGREEVELAILLAQGDPEAAKEELQVGARASLPLPWCQLTRTRFLAQQCAAPPPMQPSAAEPTFWAGSGGGSALPEPGQRRLPEQAQQHWRRHQLRREQRWPCVGCGGGGSRGLRSLSAGCRHAFAICIVTAPG